MQEKISPTQAKEIEELKVKCEALMETARRYKANALKLAVLTILSAVIAILTIVFVDVVTSLSEQAGQTQVDTQAK